MAEALICVVLVLGALTFSLGIVALMVVWSLVLHGRPDG